MSRDSPTGWTSGRCTRDLTVMKCSKRPRTMGQGGRVGHSHAIVAKTCCHTVDSTLAILLLGGQLSAVAESRHEYAIHPWRADTSGRSGGDEGEGASPVSDTPSVDTVMMTSCYVCQAESSPSGTATPVGGGAGARITAQSPHADAHYRSSTRRRWSPSAPRRTNCGPGTTASTC